MDRKRYDVETDDNVGTLPYRNAFQTGYVPGTNECSDAKLTRGQQ